MTTVAFILSTRRAGSTWLGAVLGSHPNAANLGEYFRPFLDRSHVACRLCQADGLAQCRVLHGIEDIPVERAFTFAARRLGTNVLVECSKLLDWPVQFLRQPDLDMRFIHLIRHPCGYIESETRRRPGAKVATLVDEWTQQNQHIEEFVRTSGRPHVRASYDLLADEPHDRFPALCEFLDLRFEPAALAYWNFEHHGLGGNGASSLYLRGRSQTHYITGDDAYYASMTERPLSADRRWEQRVPASLQRAATQTAYARSVAESLGVRW
ncbi:MAG: hypothetical protein KGN02_06010 [bacterium]|nr:hypothetical protein [bacterium]